MRDFGIVKPGTTLYIPFATYDSNDPSASVTMTGLATTDIEIYKNGSTTQRASDNGYALLDTDGTDFDAITGIHGFSVDLADNSDAGFYAAGAQYWIVVSSVTVDAGVVSFVAATFRIGYPDAVLNTTIATLASQTSFTLTAGPADDDALNGCVVCIHDVASAVQLGFGYISDYTGASKTVTLAAGTTFTAAATDNISIFPRTQVYGIAGTAQTAADLGVLPTRIGTPSDLGGGATISANLSDIEAQTDDIGAAGAGLTAITGVQLAADQAVNASKIGGVAVTATTSITFPAACTVATTTGAVGSVTGAVGSVTGAVGSVTGSVGSVVGHTPQTGDNYARLGAPAGASIAADIAAVKTDTGNLVTRITATLFSGITSLAEWLGLLAGKQVGNATARTEIRATGAGAGTFDETTDSQEAIRDNMGTAQTGDSFARLGAPAGASVSADIAAVKVDTAATLADTGTDGVVLSAATQNAIADALLDRNMATGTDSGSATVRTPRQALRILRNKVDTTGGTLTVTKEDDSTTSWTGALTTDAAADPVTAVDPASS